MFMMWKACGLPMGSTWEALQHPSGDSTSSNGAARTFQAVSLHLGSLTGQLAVFLLVAALPADQVLLQGCHCLFSAKGPALAALCLPLHSSSCTPRSCQQRTMCCIAPSPQNALVQCIMLLHSCMQRQCVWACVDNPEQRVRLNRQLVESESTAWTGSSCSDLHVVALICNLARPEFGFVSS